MKVVPRLISNHCTAGCKHCPYANTLGEEYAPPSSAESGEVSILTGGEPLESMNMRSWIERQIRQNIPFRIATGRHIPVAGWAAQLIGEPLFLGFNLGTDVLVQGKMRHKSIWERNWKLLQHDNRSWLTITVGKYLDSQSAISIVKKLSPATVLINADESAGSLWDITLREMGKIPNLRVVEGYAE